MATTHAWRAGNDVINGDLGNDVLYGGDDDDVIRGYNDDTHAAAAGRMMIRFSAMRGLMI
jgi:Ca2+-binding RTX toxin-like protein